MNEQHPGYGRDGKRLPNVELMTEEQMRRELVGDAVANHTGGGTAKGQQKHLARAVRMYVRIGEISGRGPEQAIQDVLDEVQTLTGVAALPVA
jgi:hypothetical protein